MAKPGSDRDGAMVDKQAGKKSKDKISSYTKTPKLDRSELLGKEGKPKSSMKRKLSFTASPSRTEERDSDTDKDGPDKKKVKKEPGGRKSSASANLLFGYPLSERKQMALLMQMTARDNSPDSTPSHPSQTPTVQKKVPSSTTSRQKDKVNKRNERGETPLHMAAIRGDAKLVKELISLGADVNVKDFAGWTPLHEACNLGFYEVAKVLLSAGAEVNTQGLDDDTPLHDASSSGHKNILKLLLRHGGNAFQANKRGERPVDVADSLELEQLLKGEVPLSDSEDSSSESEDPPSVNPSSLDDDNMEDSDADKDSDDKQTTVKASSSMSGLDEYEFKDEEEEDDLSKAFNDRNTLRRDLQQRDKEEKDGNHFAAKQSSKGDASGQSGKSKKQRTPRILCCSSDSSSDEMENPSERRSSPTCSHTSDVRSKKENLGLVAEQRDKGKIKRKSKSLSKNKENHEDGKENSKALVFSVATVSESADKSRDEDSFKMSFSPKDDSSVHLFHLSSVKSPKLNHGMTDKLPTPLKQENAKMCVSIGESPCQVDGVKYNHYTDQDYCTEGTSSKGCKHKEKSKHHQKDLNADGDDGGSSPYKDVGVSNSVDSSEGALRKTDKDGKVVKKHKLKHKEKEKHRREYEAERSRHRQKEARKDGHRNLEFDREFWKENFFKSDDNEETLPMKKETDDVGSPPKTSDASPVKEERGMKDKHSSSKEKRQREEREKDRGLKKDRKDLACKEERGKDARLSERDERLDCHGSGRIPEESLQNTGMKEEPEDKPITGFAADQDQLDASEKGLREKYDKRLPGKEKELEKVEKRHPDKEKKVKIEHTDQQNSLDRLKEKERITASSSSHSPGDRNHREIEKLRSMPMTKKHEESKKNKDKLDKRSDRERQEREYSGGEHRDKDRTTSDKRGKPPEKTPDHGKSDRLREKERDCEKKRKEKPKEGSSSSSSNLKLLLEEKRCYASESGKITSTKSKEDIVRTPEKDRDRRDRDRDSDRHRDREKDRHKERFQQSKISKSKANEADGDRAKSKASPAARDSRPKEKRLVNDDLMQTSFERMLSLKDQEIEQWHRKHLEKIKQKERERMKQRPDPGKVKSKDKAKTEPCLSKELLRSKSSEGSEAHSREKALRDSTSSRTLSLDSKSLSAVSGKVMAGMEYSLSRSPRPESERSGLISRSVSMISVASSEDSCQATTLTPRPIEYDSDLTLEAAESQPPFLQSSLLLQTTRLPVAHDSLPDAALCNPSSLSSRHASPYLRAILDEDANSVSADGKPFENLPKASVPTPTREEPLNAHAPEITTDPEETLCSHNSTLPNVPSTGSNIGVNPESETNIPSILCPQASDVRDIKDSIHPLASLSQPGVPQSVGMEQKGPSTPDIPVMPEVKCLPTDNPSVDAEPINKTLPSVEIPLLSAASLSAPPLPLSNTKTSVQLHRQQDEAPVNTETPQAEVNVSPSLDCKADESPLEAAIGSGENRARPESRESVSGSFRTERISLPVPSTSTETPNASGEEPGPGRTDVEPSGSHEVIDVDGLDSKKSRLSTDVVGLCSDLQTDTSEHVQPVSSSVSRCVSPEQKAEETTDTQLTMENKSKDSETLSSTTTEKDISSTEGSLIAESAPNRADPCPEPMEVSAVEEKPEASAGAKDPGPSVTQLGPQTELSSNSASGSSSPQSADRDSDSSGAKAKVRSLLDEEMDMQVTHPRKRKMPRVLPSTQACSTTQACPTTPQGMEKPQQSLAAMVDSVKLEEIEPYQTERANPYYEFLHIRRKIEERRKILCSVIPQPPQFYDEYVTFNGSYLIDGNPLSKLCIPTITPPPSLPEQLKEMFKQQEVFRMKLRLQHSIEREKLIVSNEQEVLRVHYRAARTLANQSLPFSACTVLLDAEVYNMPQDAQASGMMSHSVQAGDDGKTSVRDRFNARQFMSWLQDVDDKFDKLKTCLLMRQQHEAAALNAVQRLEWQLKLQELDPAMYKSTSIFEIPEFYIPLVEVNDDFDLTPI